MWTNGNSTPHTASIVPALDAREPNQTKSSVFTFDLIDITDGLNFNLHVVNTFKILGLTLMLYQQCRFLIENSKNPLPFLFHLKLALLLIQQLF